MLWFTGTPPTHTTIPCSHPHLHPPSCHSDLPQSFPFLLPLTFLISSRFLMPPLCVPHSLNPTHLHTISSSLPPCESPLLPLAPSPASSVYLAACAPSSQWKERELSLSWVCDPCQGDKLPTAACLHSWKIKNLWGREGSRCLCVNVCA